MATAIIAYTAGCEAAVDEERLGSEAKTVALSCTSAGLLLVNIALKKKLPGAQLKSGLKMIERACQMGDDVSCRTLVKMEQSVAGAGQ